MCHVSRLKKVFGQHVTPCSELPPLDDEGKLILEPETILHVQEKTLRNKTIEEYLVKWKGLPTEDVTWEGAEIFDHPNLKLLEDKQSWEGRTIMPLIWHPITSDEIVLISRTLQFHKIEPCAWIAYLM